MDNPSISLIIPVFNRPNEVEELLPNEVEELLESLTRQTAGGFEVVIVEDGSTVASDEVADHYRDRLDIHYIRIPNGGPGNARNVGARESKGDYLIVLDSDCVLPPGYICRRAISRPSATRSPRRAPTPSVAPTRPPTILPTCRRPSTTR